MTRKIKIPGFVPMEIVGMEKLPGSFFLLLKNSSPKKKVEELRVEVDGDFYHQVSSFLAKRKALVCGCAVQCGYPDDFNIETKFLLDKIFVNSLNGDDIAAKCYFKNGLESEESVSDAFKAAVRNFLPVFIKEEIIRKK